MHNYISGSSIGTAGGVLIAALAQPYNLSHPAESTFELLKYTPYSNNGENSSGANMGAYTTMFDPHSHAQYLNTISTFYDNLLNSQEMLGEDIEKAIYLNISDLYEE